MEITTELVKHLAELSRLEFSESEIENFKVEFAKTMEHINKIEEADTTGVILKRPVLDAETELRADEVKPSLTKEQVLKNAPKSLGGSIVVPTVVEEA